MNNLVGTKKYSVISSGKSIRFSFTGAFASGWDDSWQLVALGGGMSSSQASGNGSIVSGTTANSETIYRFKSAVSGDYNLRSRLFISARNANQSTFLELVDVIGDGLAITVNSATSVTVTFPQSFIPSAQNVGQSMNIGAISGIANAVPGRYAIASVSGQNVTFTVAGWPASGSGTCSIFGWNGSRLTYDGTTVTSGKFDSYRNGYGSGDTSATIATTASPGQVVAISADNGLISVVDSTQNSGTFTTRFTRSENIPDQTTTLYLQVRVVNGTVAPSTTTVSIGYVYVDEWESSVVSFGRQPGSGIAPAVTISGSIVIASGTITTVTTVTTVTNSGTPAAPATPYFVNSAASTNGALILTGTSGVHSFWATNTGATDAFVKLFNKATAPVVGTDVPEMIIPVPAAVSGRPGVAELSPGVIAYRFALGLGIAITGGSADNDTTAVAAGQVKVKLSRTV